STEIATSSASSTIHVSSQLSVSTAPTPSAPSIDVNQAETITGTIPSTGTSPYSYSWQISTNGGAYSSSTQCAVNSGSGQIATNTVTCAISGNTLSAGNTYNLKLQVTDSATASESALSPASGTI